MTSQPPQLVLPSGQTPAAPHDPLAHPGVLCIRLEPHEARQLDGLGECFIAISRATYPNKPGWCLLALPVPRTVADAACRVAMEQARPVRARPELIIANPAEPGRGRGGHGHTKPTHRSSPP